MRKFRFFLFFSQQHKSAAHSQMGDQSAGVVEIEEYVLTAAMYQIDRRTCKPFRKHLRPRVGRKQFTPEFGTLYGSAAQEPVKASDHDLDFGQFRHLRRS